MKWDKDNGTNSKLNRTPDMLGWATVAFIKQTPPQ